MKKKSENKNEGKEKRYSKLAIVSLILILSCYFIFLLGSRLSPGILYLLNYNIGTYIFLIITVIIPIISFIFAIISLAFIIKNKQKGKFIAITSLIISFIFIIFMYVSWFQSLDTSPHEPSYKKMCIGSQLNIISATAGNGSVPGKVIVERLPATGNDDVITAIVFVNDYQSPDRSNNLSVYGRDTIDILGLKEGDCVKVAAVLNQADYICPSTDTAIVLSS